jgi:hypothetical protein
MSLSDLPNPCPAAAASNARPLRQAQMAIASPAGAGSARRSAWGRRGCHLCCPWLPVHRSRSAVLPTKSLALPDEAAPSNQGRSSTVQTAALHHNPRHALAATGGWRCEPLVRVHDDGAVRQPSRQARDGRRSELRGEDFVTRAGASTPYHSPENGWPDAVRFAGAFCCVTDPQARAFPTNC